MTSPPCSIIIPVYNAEVYIAQCIESALAQTYPREAFEVIVVNDGSTDGSLDVARRYDRIKLISLPNQGVAKARNCGATASDGEYLLFLDSDDCISPEYLAATVPLMSDAKVGIVATDMQRFGLLNNRVEAKPVTLKHEMFSNDIPITSLIRREAFPGYHKMKLGGYEDWCLWIDILKRGWTAAQVNQALFHYRVREGSMIQKSHGIEAEMIAELREYHYGLNFG